jgi:hypothetical protein
MPVGPDVSCELALAKWRTMIMLLSLLTTMNSTGTPKLVLPIPRHNKREDRKIDQVATYLPSLCVRNIEVVASVVRDPIPGPSLTLPVQILAHHAGNLGDSGYAESGYTAVANPGTLGKVDGDQPDVKGTRVWLASGGKSYWDKIKNLHRNDILRM